MAKLNILIPLLICSFPVFGSTTDCDFIFDEKENSPSVTTNDKNQPFVGYFRDLIELHERLEALKAKETLRKEKKRLEEEELKQNNKRQKKIKKEFKEPLQERASTTTGESCSSKSSAKKLKPNHKRKKTIIKQGPMDKFLKKSNNH